MSFLSKLLIAVRSLRRRRGGPKTARRAGVAVEQLDHRQLLSVNFTGNVATDFPATTQPGVVVLPDNAGVTHPTIAPDLQSIIKVAGTDISGIRVSYTPQDDVLSIGIEQPSSQQPGQSGPVIAGDVDNNGNDGTVNPAVTAVQPTFQDFPDFGQGEYMGAFLDLAGTGQPDVVAGYALNDSGSPKEYQVAQATASTTTAPEVFGTPLPQYTGNVYKVNSPAHPNLEFAIDDFSQLYLAETGKTLTPDSVIGIGAFAGAEEATGVGKAYFPEQTFTLSQATIPTPTVPPASPPILINPHENWHINTARPTDIRVSILGSSGFDVTKIDPASVTFGGAHPIFEFDRHINNDPWLDTTFVFKGTDVTLPPGYTPATVTGDLTTGQTFSSWADVFNRDQSFYSAAANAQAAQRQLDAATQQNGFTILPSTSGMTATGASTSAVSVDYSPATAASTAPVGTSQRQLNAATRQNGFTILPSTSGMTATGASTSAVSVDYSPATAASTAPVGTSQRQLNAATRQNGFTILSSGTTATGASTSAVSVDDTPVMATSTAPVVTTQRRLNAATRQNGFTILSSGTAATGSSTSAVTVDYTPVTATKAAPVVKIQTQSSPQISRKMQASINRMVRATGAANVSQTSQTSQVPSAV